ncbi:MAG: hypothetical protein LLG37_03855 [Spirochaetia bacterium]|nr:hypothetical protein [Spirochaetia bacterium]
MFLNADVLEYNDDSSEITGRGNVIMRQDAMSVFADYINVNNDTKTLHAEGHVLAIQNGVSIYTDKLTYNFDRETSYAKHVDVLSAPWIVRGEELRQEGKKMQIEQPVFTTCDKVDPHYRMQASTIYFYQDDKIEAWNTVAYIGNVPVFYFPYFSQPVKNRRKPFDFKITHNTTLGWCVAGLYNVDFSPLNRLSLGYDYTEYLIGSTYKVDLAYGFNDKSTGTLLWNFVDANKSTPRARRWSVDFAHNHQFNDTTRINLRAQSVSDSRLENDFVNTGMDMFRHDYSAAFSTSFFGNQSLSFSLADTETLNTTTAKYQTSSRTLPSLSYSMTSVQLLPRFYYGHSINFTRSYHADGDYYSDTGGLYPTLTFSLPQLWVLRLSANAGLSSAWTNSSEKEKGFLSGDLLNSYSAGATAMFDLAPGGLLRGSASYTYNKQLNKLEGIKKDGITANQVSLNLNGGLSRFNYGASAAYNLLTDTAKPGNDIERLSMINLYGSSAFSGVYMNVSSLFSARAMMMKTLQLALSLSDTGASQLWKVYLATTFINGLVDSNGAAAVTPAGDTMTFTSAIDFTFTDEFRFTIGRTYDLMTKELASHVYTATWQLHCWEASISWTKRKDAAEEIYFSIFVSAIPDIKFNKPTAVAPEYNMFMEN